MARPASLLLRTNGVLTVSAVLIAITSWLAINQFVISPIAERSADDEAGLLVLSAQTWVELPPAARPYFELELADNHDLIISSDARELPPVEPGNAYFELLESKLTQRLSVTPKLMESDGLVWADIPMGGYVMQIGFSPQRRDVQPIYVAVVIFVMGAAIVFATSSYIVQRLAGPLGETAEAAEAFRGAEGFTPLPEKGPRELVTLARSFNTMAREITELLSNRTTLLAGISHDLRTPLARMRIAVELLPDDVDPKLVKRMERNLEAMDELIGDALRFARGAGEAPQDLELKPYIEAVARGVDESLEVAWRGPADVITRIAAGAFARVLTNLISNAEQHGKDAALAVEVGERVAVHVVDAGPGIPEEARERVFQPFYRLDRSRSQATGGSGLGLAIVKQLCQAHGWKISICASAMGGTDVCVEVPLREPSGPTDDEREWRPLGVAAASRVEADTK